VKGSNKTEVMGILTGGFSTIGCFGAGRSMVAGLLLASAMVGEAIQGSTSDVNL
jgi:hypothetical protein